MLVMAKVVFPQVVNGFITVNVTVNAPFIGVSESIDAVAV